MHEPVQPHGANLSCLTTANLCWHVQACTQEHRSPVTTMALTFMSLAREMTSRRSCSKLRSHRLAPMSTSPCGARNMAAPTSSPCDALLALGTGSELSPAAAMGMKVRLPA